MKIIRKGDLKKKQYRFECNACGCVFECADDEVKKESHRNEAYFSYLCPTCDKNVYGNEM